MRSSQSQTFARYRRLLAVVLPSALTAFWTVPVYASYSAYLQFDAAPFNSTNTQVVTGATNASLNTGWAPLYGADLSANDATGVLRTSDYANISNSVATVAGINDTVHFQNYQPGDVATLYYSIHGNFINNAPPGYEAQAGASGKFLVQAYTGLSNNLVHTIGFATVNSTGSGACIYSDVCIVGDSPGTTFGSLVLPITGDQYTFQMLLSLSVSGYTADFGSTARAYLSVPAGVTYTSGSGSFLTEAQPIASVPEPETYALLLAGLGVLILVARRSKSDQITSFAARTKTQAIGSGDDHSNPNTNTRFRPYVMFW